jgi:AsmA protein
LIDLMKLALKILAGVAALLLLVLAGINFLLSANAVRDRVAARVKEQTGRDLRVNGASSLLLLPSPHIVLTDVSITDPQNRAGADLAIARLSLDVSFGQLFSQRVDADRVVMERPLLTVRLKSLPAAGQQGKLDAPSRHAEADTPRFALAQSAGGPPMKRRDDVILKDVSIEDGTIRIVYDDGGSERRVEHINANLQLPHLVDPLTAKGDFDWKGLRVGFDLKLATPAELGTERAARIEFGLNTDVINADFGGYLTTRPTLSAEGDFVAKTQSVPSVLAWMRQEPGVATAIGDGQVSSHIAWTEKEVSFTNTRFALSHAVGQGQGILTLTTPRPYLRAALAVEHLNLDPLFSARGAAAGTPAAPAAPAESVQQFMEAPAEVETAQQEPAAPPSEAAPAPAAAVDGSVVLPAGFDADANIKINELRWAKLSVGPSTLGLSLRNGVLEATLNSMQLYEGTATGKLTLDGAKPVPSFTGNFSLTNVATQPLLAAAAGLNLLAGPANVTLELSGEGSTPDEIKHSLGGKGNIEIENGAIVGMNLTELIGSIGAGRMPDLDQGPGAKTAFSGLGGTFNMASGVAETHDLQMVSPLLKVSARGTVDLVTGTLDFLTQPQILAGAGGKGSNKLAGLSIPLRIEGPFEHPSFRPEIKGLFNSPDAAADTVNQIGEMLQKNLKGKPVGEALGRILGSVKIRKQPKGEEDGTGGPADEDPPTADQGQSRRSERAAPQQDEEPAPEEEPSKDPEMDEILR